MFPDEVFVVLGESAESGVSNQPMGDLETRLGARNRVADLCDRGIEGDYYVGLEGGVMELDGQFHAIAVMHVRDRHGKTGEANTSTFPLPLPICELIRGGMELGDASAQFFQHENSKQKNGAIGLLTDDLITRTDYYRHAMILALIPFKHHTMYN